MNFEKIVFVLNNKLSYLSNEELVLKCLDSNDLISKVAIEHLVARNPININLEDDVILRVIDKMTIEQIWNIASYNIDTKLCNLTYKKLCSILKYYEQLNKREELKKKFVLIK